MTVVLLLGGFLCAAGAAYASYRNRVADMVVFGAMAVVVFAVALALAFP